MRRTSAAVPGLGSHGWPHYTSLSPVIAYPKSGSIKTRSPISLQRRKRVLCTCAVERSARALRYLKFATFHRTWLYRREAATRPHFGELYFPFYILHWQFGVCSGYSQHGPPVAQGQK
jgi:hypothetical protein